MAVTKNHLVGRSSSCFRKYRILFAFGITVLCVQMYLAHSFFGLEHKNHDSSQLTSGEINSLQVEESEGLPKGLRQLKLPPDKYASTNKSFNTHRNRTTRLKIDRKTLNFIPICDVVGREAVSAITRAQSQICKERIVNVTCLSQQGLLYPEKLQSLCPHSLGFSDKPVNLGCFKDEKTSRVLSNYYHVFKTDNTPERCASMCLQSGYPYAGTEYSVECFCGTEKPSQIDRLPDSSCNMKCSGNPKQSCGGYLTINVFQTGIQRFKPQEAKNSSSKSEKEEPVRIAYLLTVNGRASRQIKRLIKALYHPRHFFYIHVDARQDYLYREMLNIEKSCDQNNIMVARGEGQRFASIWGGASLLTTLLKSAQQMLEHYPHWDFLVNLSESDFPIKTNIHLTEFLSWNRGMNFVKSHGREVQRFITKQGLDKTFLECEARMWRIADRKLPYGIQIDGGSDWLALSRNFVEYVANENPDPLVSGLLTVFRYTLLPAESFFHTVLRNSRFCNTYVDNNLHVTNWKRKLGCKCQYKAVVDWCGCSPNDFKLEDFSRIRNTIDRNLFFARKFEPVVDQRIIDRVEEWLYADKANTSIKIKGYDSYWQSIYHHADLSPLADDALLTMSASLARISLQKYNLAYNDLRVLETTAYFEANQFTGILILVEVTSLSTNTATNENNEHTSVAEIMVHPKYNFSTSRTWLGKVQSLVVNTDYDQKEQMFRNFMGCIGPYSSPVLSYEFDLSVSSPQNLSVLWIDPQGNLADINSIELEDILLVGHVKPQLSERLAVGTWQVVLADEMEIIAKLNFLVTPLSFWKNKNIDPDKARDIHDFSKLSYQVNENDNKKWSDLLKTVIQHKRNTYYVNVHNNIDLVLDQWVDALTQEHYEIDKMCTIDKLLMTKLKLPNCIDTQWSSLSPDSKADIRNLCQNY